MATVLIIDDEKSFRDTLKAFFSGRGHDVIEAANGQRAVDLIETHEIDLVITDLMMPDRDGVEVIMDIRKRQPEMPIIAVSGGGFMPAADLLGTVRHLGVKKTLQKPFELEELGDAANEILQATR